MLRARRIEWIALLTGVVIACAGCQRESSVTAPNVPEVAEASDDPADSSALDDKLPTQSHPAIAIEPSPASQDPAPIAEEQQPKTLTDVPAELSSLWQQAIADEPMTFDRFWLASAAVTGPRDLHATVEQFLVQMPDRPFTLTYHANRGKTIATFDGTAHAELPWQNGIAVRLDVGSQSSWSLRFVGGDDNNYYIVFDPVKTPAWHVFQNTATKENAPISDSGGRDRWRGENDCPPLYLCWHSDKYSILRGNTPLLSFPLSKPPQAVVVEGHMRLSEISASRVTDVPEISIDLNDTPTEDETFIVRFERQLRNAAADQTIGHLVSSDAIRRELIGHVYHARWPALGELIKDLRAWRLESRLATEDRELLDWAAARAGYVAVSRSAEHPLIERLSREAHDRRGRIMAAIADDRLEEAAELAALAISEQVGGLVADLMEPDRSWSLALAIKSAARDDAKFGRLLQTHLQQVAGPLVVRAIADANSEYITRLARLYAGTSAAAAGLCWLGDRALSGGQFASAESLYRQAHDWADVELAAQIDVKIRLASAMQNRAEGKPVTKPIDWGGVVISPQDFEVIVAGRVSAKPITPESESNTLPNRWPETAVLQPESNQEQILPADDSRRQFVIVDGHLECWDRPQQRALWATQPAINEYFLGQPIDESGRLLVLSVMRSEREEILRLRLVELERQTGSRLATHELLHLRHAWWQTRTCSTASTADSIVGAIGGAVFSCSFDGQINWLRRQPVIPHDAREKGPLGAGSRLLIRDDCVFVVQAGVKTAECLDLQFGDLVWRYVNPDIQSAQAISDTTFLVRTNRAIIALNTQTGEFSWRYPLDKVLVVNENDTRQLAFLEQFSDSGDAPPQFALVRLDFRTGKPTATTRLEGWPKDATPTGVSINRGRVRVDFVDSLSKPSRFTTDLLEGTDGDDASNERVD